MKKSRNTLWQRSRYLVSTLSLIGTLGLSVSAMADDKALWDNYNTGYKAYNDAERKFNKGLYEDALADFLRSKDAYETLHRDNPEWNTKLIRDRIKYCEDYITRTQTIIERTQTALGNTPSGNIEAVGESATSTATAPTLEVKTESTTTGVNSASTVAATRGDSSLDYKLLEQKFINLKIDSDVLRRENERLKANSGEVTGLMRDLRVANEKVALLEAKLKDSEKSSSGGNAEELLEQLTELKLIYDATLERNKALEAKINEVNSEIASVYRDRNTTRAKNSEHEDKIAALERRVDLSESKLAAERSKSSLADTEREKLLKSVEIADKKAENAKEEAARATKRLELLATDGVGAVEGDFLSENRELRKQLEEQLDEMAQTVNGLKEAQKRNRDLQLDLNRATERSRALATQVKSYEEANKIFNDKSQELTLEAKDATEEAEKLRASNKILTAANDEYASKILLLEKRIEAKDSSAVVANDKLKEEIAALEEAQKIATADKKVSASAIAALKEEIEETRNELISSQAKLRSLEVDLRDYNATKEALAKRETEFTSLAERNVELQHLISAGENRIAELENAEPVTVVVQQTVPVVAPVTVTVDNNPSSLPELNDDEVPGVREAIKKAREAGETALAIWNCKRLLEKIPNDLQGNLELGQIYTAEKRHRDAAIYLLTAASVKPDDVQIQYLLARNLLVNADQEAAEAVIYQALTQAPDEVSWLLLKAELLSLKGEQQASLELLQSLAVSNSSSELDLALARVLLALGRIDEAAVHYNSARSAGVSAESEIERLLGDKLPENRQTYSFLQKSALEAAGEGDWESAAYYYELLCAEQPESKLAVCQLVLANLGDLNAVGALAALEGLKGCSKNDIDAESIKLLNATCYLLARHVGEARSNLEEISNSSVVKDNGGVMVLPDELVMYPVVLEAILTRLAEPGGIEPAQTLEALATEFRGILKAGGTE